MVRSLKHISSIEEHTSRGGRGSSLFGRPFGSCSAIFAQGEGDHGAAVQKMGIGVKAAENGKEDVSAFSAAGPPCARACRETKQQKQSQMKPIAWPEAPKFGNGERKLVVATRLPLGSFSNLVRAAKPISVCF